MDQPSALDICCGRGKGRSNSPGNQRFKEVVQDNLQRYDDAPTKADKSRVVESVVTTIQKLGGRFVKQEVSSGDWYQIGPRDARSKVAHAIRDHLATATSCKRGLDDEEPTASKKSNKRVKRVPSSKTMSPQMTSKTMATPQSLQQHQFVVPQACLSHPDGATVPTLFSQAAFPITDPMNASPTQWQSQQQMFHSVPNSTNHAPLNLMQNQRLQASNGGQGRVISTIGRPRQEDVNVMAFPFLPLSSSFTSLQNMSNQHRVMSISNDMMQGQLAAADLPPNSQQQDLPTSRNLLAAGFQSRERLLQPAISSTMVGQDHQDICEITGFSLSGGSRQGLERPQSPEERMQLAPTPLRVQSYAHDVAIHPEETRLMLSRQVSFGVSKQSRDCADGAEYIGEDEYHNTPTLQEDFEPNAIFPPE
jgi:hypothetical protein